MAEETFEEILAGEKPTAEETTEATDETTESEVTEEEATDETTEVEEVTATAAEEEPWTKTAYLDEKRKRQDLEKRLIEQEAAKPLPDVLEDQEGFTGAMQNMVRNEVGAVKVQLSQDMMRELHEDYDEREAKFMQLAEGNQTLLDELSSSPNPARFAYNTAIQHEEAQQLKDLPAYKAKIEAELRAKIMAELEAGKTVKAEKTAEKEGALKPSITDVGSSDAETTLAEEPFEDIIGTDANHRKR